MGKRYSCRERRFAAPGSMFLLQTSLNNCIFNASAACHLTYGFHNATVLEWPQCVSTAFSHVAVLLEGTWA